MFEIGLVFIVASMIFIATLSAKNKIGDVVMLFLILVACVAVISFGHVGHTIVASIGGYILGRLWLARGLLTRREEM